MKNREVSERTLLTIVLDMCNKGTLAVYFLRQSGEPEHDWERSILDSLPRGRFEPQELKNQLKRHTSDISKQMDDYVQRIGWFDGGPLAGKYSGSSEKMSGLFALGAMLAGIGFGMWTVWYWPWWASCLTGLAFGVVHLAVGWLAQGAATSDLPPTELGQREISRWRQCQRWLKDVSPAARPQEHEQLLPYAVALDVAKPWFFSRHPSWFAVLGEDPEPVWEFRQSMKFHEFIVDDAWDLAGRPHRGGGGGGGDSGGGG